MARSRDIRQVRGHRPRWRPRSAWHRGTPRHGEMSSQNRSRSADPALPECQRHRRCVPGPIALALAPAAQQSTDDRSRLPCSAASRPPRMRRDAPAGRPGPGERRFRAAPRSARRASSQRSAAASPSSWVDPDTREGRFPAPRYPVRRSAQTQRRSTGLPRALTRRREPSVDKPPFPQAAGSG